MVDEEKIQEYLVLVRKECLIRGFSKRTVRTYSYFVSEYLMRVNDVDSYLVSESNLKRYVWWQVDKRKRTEETIRLSLSAVGFFARTVLNIKNASFEDLVVRPKRKKKLPKVLSKNEIRLMIEKTVNVKHKLIIQILYSSGLRLNELRNLKRNDLNLVDGTLMVRNGKGGKDRRTLLSKKLSLDINDYIMRTPFKTEYLFEGRDGKISAKTIQKVISQAADRVGIRKNVHPHMLRHSFATHLLESGVNIKIIQQLLGHSKLETTQGYTYVASSNFRNIKNPLDELD